MQFCTPESLEPYELFVYGENVYLLCRPIFDGLPDLETSLLFSISDGEATFVRRFELEVCGLSYNNGQLHLVDEENTLFSFSGVNWREEEDRIESPASQLIVVKAIEGQLFGLTTDGSVHIWQEIGWAEVAVDDDETFFYDIDVNENGEIHVVGENGFFARLDGTELSKRIVPTTEDLLDLLFLGDRFLVVGRRGTCLIGTHAEIELLDTGSPTNHFLNAVEWQGRTMISATDAVLEIKNGCCVLFSTTKADRIATTEDDVLCSSMMTFHFGQETRGNGLRSRSIWNSISSSPKIVTTHIE